MPTIQTLKKRAFRHFASWCSFAADRYARSRSDAVDLQKRFSESQEKMVGNGAKMGAEWMSFDG
jgi:hypothetical protein